MDLFRELFPGVECPELRTFILSGVILSPTEYYFCRRKEKQLINLADDEDMSDRSSATNIGSKKASAMDAAARAIYEDFQWYKVSKTFTDEGVEVPSAVEVIDLHEITASAKTGSVDFGSQEVILVYATLENAWNTAAYGNYELSPELKEFIERDRKSLLSTMREQEAAAAAIAAAASTPSEGSVFPENALTPDSLLAGATSGAFVNPDAPAQRLASSSDPKRGNISIRTNSSVYPSIPTGATTVPGATSMVSVKELSDTASPDDSDNHSTDGDGYSRAGENVATKIINDADANAMELEFEAFKKN